MAGRAALFWGKIRRVWLRRFRRGYVKKQMALRQGECIRCGACCNLGMKCWFLNCKGDITRCTIHNNRPRNCSAFPIDERDLADRNAIDSASKCGYSFMNEKESKKAHNNKK